MTLVTQMLMILLLSAIISNAEENDNRKLEEIILISAHVADIVTTEMWIHKGGSEGNPIVLAMGGDNLAGRVAIKSVSAAGAIVLGRLLDKKLGAKAGSVFRWMTIIPTVGVTGWNVSLVVRY